MAIGIFLATMIGAWFAIGPRVMADVSNMRYSENSFDYSVEIDESFDTGSQKWTDIGIRVRIKPDYQPDNPSAFSEEYLAVAEKQLSILIQTKQPDASIDALVLFNRPLSLEEANSILYAINAELLQSGIVGYGAADGIPFAAYRRESGSLLTKDLAALAELYKGFEPEIIVDDVANTQPPSDIRGYMGIRLIVPAAKLTMLSQHEFVQFVDTTPQIVRDMLAMDIHWRNTPINSMSIEMPVWAYPWE